VKAVGIETLREKEKDMKRNIAIALLTLLSLAAVGQASAQQLAIQAAVPFEFTVGGKLLPADTYTITLSSPGVVQIQSADKHFTAVTTVEKQVSIQEAKYGQEPEPVLIAAR